jgi:hypothetical protein
MEIEDGYGATKREMVGHIEKDLGVIVFDFKMSFVEYTRRLGHHFFP